MRELAFRPPMAARIFVLIFCGGFVVAVAASLLMAVTHRQDISGAPFAIGMALFAGTLGYRLASLSCRARGPEMIIHNYWRTRRVTICQIDGLDIGRASAGDLWTIRVLTNGKAVPIDVLGITGGFLGRMPPRRMEALERRRLELADWLGQAGVIVGTE